MSDLEHEGEVPAGDEHGGDVTARAIKMNERRGRGQETQGGGGAYSAACWPIETDPTNAGSVRKTEK